MIENIYFVPNHHGLQGFLSLYQPKKNNLIITCQLNGSPLGLLFEQILPNEQILVIPSFEFMEIGKFYRTKFTRLKVFWQVLSFRLRIPRLVDSVEKISPKAKVYCFHDGATYFALIANFLAKRGCTLQHIYMGQQFVCSQHDVAKEYSNLSLKMRWDLKILNFLSGIQFAWYQYCNLPKVIRLGWQNSPPRTLYTPENWEILAKKYGIQFEVPADAILFVDGAVQSYLDIAKTNQNLVTYFKPWFERGVPFYVKKHPDNQRNIPFKGTAIESKINIVPQHLPVEFIMHHFAKVYFYQSASAHTPIPGKKYSISHLLVFKNKGREEKYWKALKIHPIREDIEFVRLTPE